MLAGLVTAWRLASWPTSRSPVLVKATTDGIGPAALGGRDDGRLAALHDRDDRVGRAEVDADDLAHVSGLLVVSGALVGQLMSVGSRPDRRSAGRSRHSSVTSPRRRPRSPAGGPGPGCGSRAGARRQSPSGCLVPGRLTSASCSRGSNGVPALTSIGLTPSLSSRRRSLRSMAAMPSTHGSPASPSAGRRPPDRSRRPGRALCGAARQTPGRASRSRSSAVRRLVVLELRALALEPGEVFLGLGTDGLQLTLELVDLLEELGR